MIQTVELELMNGRYTIEANVELKAVPNYIEVDGYRDDWTDYEYVSHQIVSVWDNFQDAEVRDQSYGVVTMYLDTIVDAAQEQAAKERQ
jgi:hypothetical protein